MPGWTRRLDLMPSRRWLVRPFCPMGPIIVSRDMIDANRTAIKLWVNDQLRQDDNTSDFIFKIPTVIAALSRGV